ncbi:MAG TPA: hypothetical protein VMM57_00105 [Bacteroidota bacterium]|nr:hypothetical protein [Bacteroidota bacterium]
MHEKLTVRPFEFSSSFGYGVSAVTFTAGLVIVSGLFLPAAVPLQFRLTFGIVLVLLGIYRFVVTRTRVSGHRLHNE